VDQLKNILVGSENRERGQLKKNVVCSKSEIEGGGRKK